MKTSIIAAFKNHNLTSFEYLDVDGGQLVIATNQELGGEIVDRRGALYLREKDTEATL